MTTVQTGVIRTIIPRLSPITNINIIDDTSQLHDRVTIGCRAEGLPQPSITWFRSVDSGPLEEVNTSLNTFNVTSPGPGESLLTAALSLDETNCFTYACVADNGIGSVSGSAQVCPEREIPTHLAYIQYLLVSLPP